MLIGKFNAFKVNILLITFFFIASIISLSANSEVDSLLNLLTKSKHDTNRVEILNELSFLTRYSNSIHSEKYAIDACSLAKNLKYLKGQGDCKVRLGILSKNKGDFNKAIFYYKEALEIRKNDTNLVSIASIYNNIGLCFTNQNKFKEAIEHFKKGISILNKKNTPINRVKGSLYNNLSDSYRYMGAFKLAAIYSDSSLHVWNKTKSNIDIANTLFSKSDLDLKLENWENAKQNLKKSLTLFLKEKDNNGQARCYISLGNIYFDAKEYDLALENYKKADKLKEYLNLNDLAYLFFNYAGVYKENGNHKKSLENYQISLDFFEQLEAPDDIASVYYEIGGIHKINNNYSSAKDSYIKGLSYLNEDSDYYLKTQTIFNLAEVYSKLGNNDLALQYSQQYNDLRDSIYANQLEAINYQTNQEAKQRKIAQLEANNLAKEKINQRNYFLMALLIAAILILTAMFYAYRNRQKTKEAYLEIDDILQEQELTIAYARLEEKDATQKQIGQDLHDRLGMMLSTIKLYFNEFSEQVKELKTDNRQKRDKTFELLDEAVQEVRRIAHNMQSGILKKFGLAEAVKDLGTTITDSGQLTAKVYTHGLKERIPNELEYKLFKIIQELVSNALKHGKAKQLTISLSKQENLLNLMVEDDGIGFNPSEVADKGGMGLKNVTFRVTELSGTCHFDSVKGRGTNVIIDIPLKSDS